MPKGMIKALGGFERETGLPKAGREREAATQAWESGCQSVRVGSGRWTGRVGGARESKTVPSTMASPGPNKYL